MNFVKKELLHTVRDWRMLLVVVMIPVVQMLLFGFAISTEVNDIRVVVHADKLTEETRRAMERLRANPYVTLVGEAGRERLPEELRAGRADAALHWDSHGRLQIITDASNPNMAQSAAAYLQAITAEPSRAGGAGPDDLLRVRYLYNPQLKSSYNFVPGIMGMLFLLVCALMTAVAIVREKETGSMELLLCSPLRPTTIIMSKMVPFLLLSCLDLALILLIARYLLEVPLGGGVVAVAALSLLYIVLSLGLGLLVSTISRDQVMAMLLCGMVMIMPVIMLSGLIFPIDNLPPVLSQLSAIVPARWYIDAMRKLMVEGLAITEVWDDVLILAAMTGLILVVAVRNFKDRL